MTNTDLPAGYRWATADECEQYATGNLSGAIVVPRTADSNGVPYTQDEADLAVPNATVMAVIDFIESLPMERRLYPELYAVDLVTAVELTTSDTES